MKDALEFHVSRPQLGPCRMTEGAKKQPPCFTLWHASAMVACMFRDELARAKSMAGYDLIQANCQHYAQDFWKFAVGHRLGMPNQEFLNLFKIFGAPSHGGRMVAPGVLGNASYAITSVHPGRSILDIALLKLPVVPARQEEEVEVEADSHPRGGAETSASTAPAGREHTTAEVLQWSRSPLAGAPVVVTMAATNRYHCLDEALVRPGRLDRIVMVSLPNQAERVATLQIHAAKLRTENLDLQLLARRTEGMSGADLANLLNEAALLAARRRADAVRMDHIWDVLGNPRPKQQSANGWNDDTPRAGGLSDAQEQCARMLAAFATAFGSSRSSGPADSLD
eukprot:s315_g6.t1